MSFAKFWVAVVAIAAAVSLQVAADKDLKEVCSKLNRVLIQHKPIRDSPQKSFMYAKEWLNENTGFFSKVKSKLSTALEDIKSCHDCKPCSESSWDRLLTLIECRGEWSLKFLVEPMKKYVKECFKPDYVSRKLKKDNKGVEKILDAGFIKRFYDDNRKDVPLYYDWIIKKDPRCPSRHPDCRRMCCKPKTSYGALNDTIQRDFDKRQVERSDYFVASPPTVLKYLEKKLFAPCKQFVSHYQNLASEAEQIAEYYEGGPEGFISTLDQEAKDTLFRYKYCALLGRGQVEEDVFNQMVKMLV